MRFPKFLVVTTMWFWGLGVCVAWGCMLAVATVCSPEWTEHSGGSLLLRNGEFEIKVSFV